MTVVTQTISALPTPPSRSTSSSTFATAADAFVAALPILQSQINTVTGQINTVAGEVSTNATAAATAATNATTNGAAQVTLATGYATAAQQSAIAAAAVTNCSAWVSGTTYAIGNTVFSPINGFSYRRIVAGAGTIDPSADTTNWAAVVATPPPVPIAGVMWLHSTGAFSPTYTINNYTYLQTGVLALQSSYPSYPKTCLFVKPSSFTTFSLLQLNSGSNGNSRGSIRNAASSGTRIVALNSTSVMQYTTTGSTWASGAVTTSLAHIVYGAGLFITPTQAAGTTVYSTPDGVTATARTMPSSGYWTVSEYANTQFIAVNATSAATNTAKSADGINWVAGGALPTSTGSWLQPLRVGSNWVTVNSDGTTAYSPDGTTWTSGTGGTSTASGVASYGTGSFVSNGSVAVQTANSATVTTYRYTSNGSTWTDVTLPASYTFAVTQVVNGIFVFVGNGNVVYTSTNGTSLTSITASGSDAFFYFGTTYYRVTASGTNYYTSTDFATWSSAKTSAGGLFTTTTGLTNAGAAVLTLGNYLIFAKANAGAVQNLDVADYSNMYIGEPTAITSGSANAYVRVS
jgi:hypothetical protein